MEDLEQFAIFVIAIILATLLSLPVANIFKKATDPSRPDAPLGISEDDWKEIYDPGKESKKGGIWIGWLERYLFLGAFLLGQPIVIGVWLAFKLGTKWEVWKDVVRVPEKLKGAEEISYLQRRSAWGSWLLNRFLIGTLLNLLIALVAYLTAPVPVWIWQHWCEITGVTQQTTAS